MATLTDTDKESLLRLARATLEARLLKNPKIKRAIRRGAAVKQKRGCFVTLHIDQRLRGCIGNIEPVKPLVVAVEENALSAAFKDPRFPPLQSDELPGVNIEISVLTPPRALAFENGEDLKRQLKPGIHGVILARGWLGSTFLPQVWQQLPDKETFLEHLCRKGSMEPDCWQDNETVVKVYEVEYFSE